MVTLPSKHSTFVPRIDFGDASFLMTIGQDELAMIQDNVSSSIIGEMRMQFWKDAVKALVEVRWPPVYSFASHEHDLGQTSTSPHCSSST
jgi:hypothetical protein